LCARLISPGTGLDPPGWLEAVLPACFSQIPAGLSLERCETLPQIFPEPYNVKNR